MARWKSCLDHQPDTERQVLVARPDRLEVEAAQYYCPEEAWVEAGTDVQIWPSVWQEMPASPFAGD